MANFLANGVMDLRQTISTHTMAIGGDGHYFEENDSPEKLKGLLDSAKVSPPTIKEMDIYFPFPLTYTLIWSSLYCFRKQRN